MALSGSVRTSECEGRSVTLNWTASQSIENNRSTISWSLVGSGSAGGWVMVNELRVTINGSQAYYRSSSNHTECWIGTTLASGTMNIDHNSDGTKTFAISVQAGIYEWSINCSGSGSFVLNTIPRAAAIDSFTCSTAYLDGTYTVRFTPKTSSFYYKLRLSIPKVLAIRTDSLGNKGTSQQTITKSFTSTELQTIYGKANANSESLIIGAVIETYSDSAYSNKIGESAESKLTLNLPANIVPTISSVVTSDPTGYASSFNGYVQNKSQLKVQVNASGVYNSTIKTVAITFLGNTVTQNPFTSNVIAESGVKSVSVKVTDTRGRTAEYSKNITIYDYASPQITKLAANRCDMDGTLNDEGAYMKVSYAGVITNIANSGLNAKTMTIKHREQGTSEWIGNLVINQYTVDSYAIIEADTEKEHEVLFTVADSFSSVEKTWAISTAFTLMDFNESGKGVAFGKVSERNGFEMAMDVYFSKKLNGLFPVGAIYISTTDTNPSAYFGGTWEQIKDRFLLAAGDTYQAGATGGEATHTLTLNEIPSHQGHMYDNMNDGGWVDRGGDDNSYFLNSDTAKQYGYGKYENRPWKIVSGNEFVMQGYSRGGSQAHNNMPPYLTVYVWKRTA